MAAEKGKTLQLRVNADYARRFAAVARARGLSPARIRTLLAGHTEGRQWGFLGEPRVNVLELNLALDAESRATR